MQVVKNNGRCSILVYAGNIHAAKQKKSFLCCFALCFAWILPNCLETRSLALALGIRPTYLSLLLFTWYLASSWTDLTSPRVS